MAEPIYVETHIRVPMDELWHATQEPSLHSRWDLRFSEITYLPRVDPSAPQQFLYTTRIGFGISISGTGSSVGERVSDSNRTSALEFGSTDPKSLIEYGSGYWQYLADDTGVRFLTRYGYQVRFGIAGRIIDRLLFRPLMGWATAWSFDRLRLWLESGIDPTLSLFRSAVNVTARIALALIWVYQGVVPKLLFPERGELDLFRASGLFSGQERAAVTVIGLAEIAFALLLLIFWHQRILYLLAIAILIGLTTGAALSQPGILIEPFNPISLTIAMLALAAIGYLASRDLPSASNCLRSPVKGSP